MWKTNQNLPRYWQTPQNIFSVFHNQLQIWMLSFLIESCYSSVSDLTFRVTSTSVIPSFLTWSLYFKDRLKVWIHSASDFLLFLIETTFPINPVASWSLPFAGIWKCLGEVVSQSASSCQDLCNAALWSLEADSLFADHILVMDMMWFIDANMLHAANLSSSLKQC